MAAKVINFHSPDGKNTYELTFTRDSVEATERAGFQVGQYTQMTICCPIPAPCSTVRSLPGIVASSVKSWTKCLPTSTRRKS